MVRARTEMERQRGSTYRITVRRIKVILGLIEVAETVLIALGRVM